MANDRRRKEKSNARKGKVSILLSLLSPLYLLFLLTSLLSTPTSASFQDSTTIQGTIFVEDKPFQNTNVELTNEAIEEDVQGQEDQENKGSNESAEIQVEGPIEEDQFTESPKETIKEEQEIEQETEDEEDEEDLNKDEAEFENEENNEESPSDEPLMNSNSEKEDGLE